MSIRRAPRPESGFTLIRDEVLRDTRLSYRARGVLAAILSRPDNWRTDSEQLAKEGTEGRDAIRAALRELEQAGYIERIRAQVTTPTGKKVWNTETVVHDTPSGANPQVVPTTGFQAPEFPTVGKPGPVVTTEKKTTTPLPPAPRTAPPRPGRNSREGKNDAPKGTDGHLRHQNHENAKRACINLQRDCRLPLDAAELLAWSYRLGKGDPWSGYREVKRITEPQLDTADDALTVVRARLRKATPHRRDDVPAWIQEAS